MVGFCLEFINLRGIFEGKLWLLVIILKIIFGYIQILFWLVQVREYEFNEPR